MKKSIDQLKEVLIKENEMYKKVLKIAELKTNAIISGDIETLENITKQEQEYIMTMETFEKLRRSIFVNIAKKLNIDETSGVSELILFLEEDIGKEIDDLRDKLLETVDELKNINEKNEKLLRQNLEYINFNLEMLTTSPDEGNRYSNKAAEDKKRKPINFFDMKV